LISGDLLTSGGEVIFNGRVKGEIKSVSGSFVLNGIAANDIDIRGGKIAINGEVYGAAILAADVIDIGDHAEFSKAVKYWNGTGTVDFHNSMKGNEAIFDSSLAVESGKWHYLGFATFLMVIWYLGTALIFIMLIHYLFARTFQSAAVTVRNASLRSLGVGLLFLIGVPVAIIIAFVTIVGLPIGMLILIAYVTMLLLGTVVVSLLAAHWINNVYNRSWSNARIILAALAIFIFLKLASLTPVIGPVIMFLMVCIGFGGILQNVAWKRSPKLSLT
jgi:hypothetical protein